MYSKIYSRQVRWWLAKETLSQQPDPREITRWFEFVAQNFIYRGAWGLGSILGLLLDLGDSKQSVRALEIADWPRSGLPWIAFWLKELITWGTLDPVAAFLLARGNTIDRQQAQTEARAYFTELPANLTPNEALDPRRIREFVDARRARPERAAPVQGFSVNAKLDRKLQAYRNERITVAPIDIKNRLIWIDPAGYTVARSTKPTDWPEVPANYTFELHVRDAVVFGKAYLPYA